MSRRIASQPRKTAAKANKYNPMLSQLARSVIADLGTANPYRHIFYVPLSDRYYVQETRDGFTTLAAAMRRRDELEGEGAA